MNDHVTWMGEVKTKKEKSEGGGEEGQLTVR